MLHLIPPPLHRAALRLAHGLRKRWWWVRKPRLQGCRVLAIDSAGRVLLIRHSYGSGQWMAPGGGVRRGEAPVAAAVRELREEAGCMLATAVQVAVVVEPMHGARNAVHVIAGRATGQVRPDGREVIEAAFFALDALPGNMPAGLRAELPGWVAAYRG